MATPLKKLAYLGSPEKTLYAKLEGENPTGSLKDRMVGRVLDLMIASGDLKRGDVLVEASSGNTGIALSSAARDRGFQVIVCVAEHISGFKKKRMAELGAEVRELDARVDHEAEIKAAQALGRKEGYCFFNQFENPFHVQAYRETLGAELLDQVTALCLKIDVLVAGVGTGASLRAAGEVLRAEHNPGLKISAVSPKVYPTLIEGAHAAHLRDDFPIWMERPPGFEKERILIEDRDAVLAAMEIRDREGLSVGPCSGAVVFAATRHIREGGTFLLLFSDNGNRYQALYEGYGG